MRTCWQCKTTDRPIPQPGEKDPDHFVKVELKFFEGTDQWKPKYAKQGWRAHKFRGKDGMERHICVLCMNQNKLRDEVWKELKDGAKKMEAKTDDDMADYYRLLCAN